MSDPHQEHPNTYFVQDRENQEELGRLHLQDQMLTRQMGGVLPEQPDPTSFKRVLDIGCGTGGWLIEAAKTYPSMTQLFGIDTSGKTLAYARAQAKTEQVSDRVEFLLMDALRMLEFPSGFFDLVNMRLAQGWMRTWDWPKLLQEAQRVSRPDGVIRLTEPGGNAVDSTSPALNRLYRLSIDAMYRAGHYFAPEGNTVIAHLPRVMHQYGVRNVQTRVFTIAFPAGTPEGRLFAEDIRLLYRIMLPFLRKWTQVPDDYEDIYQQALAGMQAPDFTASWDMLTVWGNKGY